MADAPVVLSSYAHNPYFDFSDEIVQESHSSVLGFNNEVPVMLNIDPILEQNVKTTKGKRKRQQGDTTSYPKKKSPKTTKGQSSRKNYGLDWFVDLGLIKPVEKKNFGGSNNGYAWLLDEDLQTTPYTVLFGRYKDSEENFFVGKESSEVYVLVHWPSLEIFTSPTGAPSKFIQDWALKHPEHGKLKSRYSGYEYLRFRKLDFRGMFNQQVDVTLSTVKSALTAQLVDQNILYHNDTRRVSDLNNCEYPADFQESPYQQPVKAEPTQDFVPIQRPDTYTQKYDAYLEMPSYLGMGIQPGAKINIVSNSNNNNNNQLFDFTPNDFNFSADFRDYNDLEDIHKDIQNNGASLFGNNDDRESQIDLTNLTSIGLTEEQLMALMSSPTKAQ